MLIRRPTEIASPNGRVVVRFRLDEQGQPSYKVLLDGQVLLASSPLGLVTTAGAWVRGLVQTGASKRRIVRDEYELLHGKCNTCRYEAHRKTIHLENDSGRRLNLVFQVSDDGVAFRYNVPRHGSAGSVTAEKERTGFRLPEGTRSWIMPMEAPDTGWQQTNPSYEAYYTQGAPVGAAAPNGVGWAYPALFQHEGVGWALVTEAGLDRSYVATRLSAEEEGLYRVAYPEPGEGTGPGDPVEPSFRLPFSSPWRVVIVGKTLGPIVESTLVTDVSPPAVLQEAEFVDPGKVAWSWLPLKDESITPEGQRRFIDMAATQGYEYCLVDNWWDEQIGYDGLEELVDYADRRGVELLVWYNSNGNYNDAPQTPQDRMHTAEVRREEFARLQKMGVRGVKVDFFGGDKQSVVQHYLDLFRDAARYDLLVNVHGATLPRGWHRTYPHFMTAEAVQGYEYITFAQENADRAPRHATVLPFTRNVVGPMDFTPTMFTDSVGVSKRRTSNAFDLAMTVVFESGLQHLGVTPEGLDGVPAYVRTFLEEVPAAWDETRFVEGFPGEYVALARRKGDRWYVAGFNGQEKPQSVTLEADFLREAAEAMLITDGDDRRSFERRSLSVAPGRPVKVVMPPRGGFILVTASDP